MSFEPEVYQSRTKRTKRKFGSDIHTNHEVYCDNKLFQIHGFGDFKEERPARKRDCVWSIWFYGKGQIGDSLYGFPEKKIIASNLTFKGCLEFISLFCQKDA